MLLYNIKRIGKTLPIGEEVRAFLISILILISFTFGFLIGDIIHSMFVTWEQVKESMENI